MITLLAGLVDKMLAVLCWFYAIDLVQKPHVLKTLTNRKISSCCKGILVPWNLVSLLCVNQRQTFFFVKSFKSQDSHGIPRGWVPISVACSPHGTGQEKVNGSGQDRNHDSSAILYILIILLLLGPATIPTLTTIWFSISKWVKSY